MLADDIKQEMYLKMNDYFSRKINGNLNGREIKDTYIYVAILNIFKNHTRIENKTVSLEGLHYIKSSDEIFYPDDEQKKVLDAYDKIDWKQQHLLELIYDMSYREIEREYILINYGYAFTQVKKARETILK